MSGELERTQPRSSLTAKIAYAEKLAHSGLLPAQYRKQPANVLWAVEFGEMLGISPMAAITGVHVIDGKPSASAGLISALVRRAGHQLRVVGDDRHAVAEIVRADDPDFTFRSEWTLDRARQAELLGKGNWKKYPAAMLTARAITEAARNACEEALSGVHYTPEELGAEVDADGTVVGEQATVDSGAGHNNAQSVRPSGPPISAPANAPSSSPAQGAQADVDTHVDTDPEWLADIQTRIGSIEDKETARPLWIEITEQRRFGRCSAADADELKALIKTYTDALDKADAIVDADVVEDTVTDQQWADGFEKRVDRVSTRGEVRGLAAELESVASARKLATEIVEHLKGLVANRETELTAEVAIAS